MAEAVVAGQTFDHSRREKVSPTRPTAFAMKSVAVEGYDTGGFLAAMLESVQPERSDGGGVRVAENTENAAFLAKGVTVQIQIQQVQFSRIGRTQIAFFRVRLVLCGVFGRALFAVHRASLLAWFHRAAGFSISFFRLSRAGLV